MNFKQLGKEYIDALRNACLSDINIEILDDKSCQIYQKLEAEGLVEEQLGEYIITESGRRYVEQHHPVSETVAGVVKGVGFFTPFDDDTIEHAAREAGKTAGNLKKRMDELFFG